MVVPDRHRQPEQRLQQPVQRRRLEQVLAADDVGDALRGVVDDDGEVVGRGADVPARQHHVAEPGEQHAAVEAMGAGLRGAGLGPGQPPGVADEVEGAREVEADGVARADLGHAAAAAGAGIERPSGVRRTWPSCGAESAARMSARVQRQG